MLFALAQATEPVVPPKKEPGSVFVPTGIAGGIAGSAAGTLTVWGLHNRQRCPAPTYDCTAKPLSIPALSAGFVIGGLAGMGGGLALGRAATGKNGRFAVALGTGIGAVGLTSLALALDPKASADAWRIVGVSSVFAVGPLLGLAVSGKQRPPRGTRIGLAPSAQGGSVILEGRW